MKVQFSLDAFRKWRALSNNARPPGDKGSLREISAIGAVDVLPNGDLYLSEVFLMPQEASYGHVDLDMDGWAAVVTGLIETGREDVLSKLHAWLHTHPGSLTGAGKQPQFSSIDTGTMDKFELKDGFLLSIVSNEQGACTARYDQWYPVRQKLEIPVEIVIPPYSEAEATPELLAEIADKVRFKTFQQTAWFGRNTKKWCAKCKADGDHYSYDHDEAMDGRGKAQEDADEAWGLSQEEYEETVKEQDGSRGHWQLWREDEGIDYYIMSCRRKKDALREVEELERTFPGSKYEVRYSHSTRPPITQERLSEKNLHEYMEEHSSQPNDRYMV